ncbi:MAG: sulfocyanin-like copper-binding protein [Tepidiformaceae bacterium]
MRYFTFFLTGICLLALAATTAVACGDDDSNATKTASHAATAVVTNAQGAASAVASSVQGAASAVSGSATASSSGQETEIKATEKDFSITLGTQATSGHKVEFKIHNDGPTTHEFVVFKTDLAEDKMPLNSDGTGVQEDAPSVTHIDEKEDIQAGDDESLDIDDLAPGHYVIICNIPGHYQLGMHAALTVS